MVYAFIQELLNLFSIFIYNIYISLIFINIYYINILFNFIILNFAIVLGTSPLLCQIVHIISPFGHLLIVKELIGLSHYERQLSIFGCTCIYTILRYQQQYNSDFKKAGWPANVLLHPVELQNLWSGAV